MPRLQSANNAETTVIAGIAPSDNSFQVSDSSLFPNAPFRASINGEILEVGAIDRITHTFSNIQRGLEGTAASNHSSGSTIQNRFTAGTYDELETSIDAQQKADQAKIDAIQTAKNYVNSLGIGVEPPSVSDANNVNLQTGFYTVIGSTTNTPTTNGSLIHILKTGQPTQIFIDNPTRRMWVRTRQATSWSDWVLQLSEISGIRSHQENNQVWQHGEGSVSFVDTNIVTATVTFSQNFQNTQYKAWAVPTSAAGTNPSLGLGPQSAVLVRADRQANQVTFSFATLAGAKVSGNMTFYWGAIG